MYADGGTKALFGLEDEILFQNCTVPNERTYTFLHCSSVKTRKEEKELVTKKGDEEEGRMEVGRSERWPSSARTTQAGTQHRSPGPQGPALMCTSRRLVRRCASLVAKEAFGSLFYKPGQDCAIST